MINYDAKYIAQQFFNCNPKTDDLYKLLSLAPNSSCVTFNSTAEEIKRNYRRIALLIHPDKIQSTFDGSTKAFQNLVLVFEACIENIGRVASQIKKQGDKGFENNAENENERKKEGKSLWKSDTILGACGSKTDVELEKNVNNEVFDNGETQHKSNKLLVPRPARSNTNCYKTPLSCPNCHSRWIGDDAAHYTLLMSYSVRVFCQVCLFQFGPTSATHFCPFCDNKVDYDVSFFDKQIECPHCKKQYGFFSVPISEKRLKTVRARNQEEEDRALAVEDRSRRAEMRMQRKESGKKEDSSELDYIVGQGIITGDCPVCRKFNIKGGEKAIIKHVTDCHNKKKARKTDLKRINRRIINKKIKKTNKKK